VLLRVGAANADTEAPGSGRVPEPLWVELHPGDCERRRPRACVADERRAAPHPQVMIHRTCLIKSSNLRVEILYVLVLNFGKFQVLGRHVESGD
jgi:hypothetical protein